MAQVFKKKNLFIIVSAIIVAVGLLAFILAYGLADGWDAVGAWFGSPYAILLYIGLGCYGLLVTWLIVYDKVKRL